MTTKKVLLGAAAGAAIAGIAMYMMKRNKMKMKEATKQRSKTIAHHLTNVFHNAKASAERSMADA